MLRKLIRRPENSLDKEFVAINKVFDAMIYMKSTNTCRFNNNVLKNYKVDPRHFLHIDNTSTKLYAKNRNVLKDHGDPNDQPFNESEEEPKLTSR